MCVTLPDRFHSASGVVPLLLIRYEQALARRQLGSSCISFWQCVAQPPPFSPFFCSLFSPPDVGSPIDSLALLCRLDFTVESESARRQFRARLCALAPLIDTLSRSLSRAARLGLSAALLELLRSAPPVRSPEKERERGRAWNRRAKQLGRGLAIFRTTPGATAVRGDILTLTCLIDSPLSPLRCPSSTLSSCRGAACCWLVIDCSLVKHCLPSFA